MPQIDLSILNQRQTPAFYADVLANRPAAGFVGRIFISTNTFAFFRDNGTGWDLIGGPGTGTVTGSGANGQVSFWNGASSITGTNDLFWDSVNGHLGIGTNVPGTALQIDHDQNQFIRLNQTTATNDTKIAFQNSGIALWRIGNSYNAGANDFGIYDVVGSIQPVTVKKTTGQVLIGTSTVGSGKLVVASATGDNHIQIVGATAPSLRIDSAESGPTKRIGLGLATAVNNFIQNSQNLDMCIFNGSTSAAGNMLFGIYDTALANVQEAARISSARNFLIGTITDTGQKLQVSGTALISGKAVIGGTSVGTFTAYSQLTVGTTTTTNNALTIASNVAGSGLIEFAQGVTGNQAYRGYIQYNHSTDVMSFATVGTDRLFINSAGNVGIGISAPASKLNIFGTGANTQTIIQESSAAAANCYISHASTSKGYVFGLSTDFSNSWILYDSTSAALRLAVSTSGNLLIGTSTDAGYKLLVAGTTYLGGITQVGQPVGSHQLNANVASGADREIFIAGVIGVSNGFRVRFDNATSTVRVSMSSLPTSPVGLSTGDLWNNLGILNIV